VRRRAASQQENAMSSTDDTITNNNEERVVKARDPYVRNPAARGNQPTRWSDKVEKLHFGSLDVPSLTVVAQYNPNQLQIDKQITWKRPERLSGSNPDVKKDDEVELPTAPTRSMNLELLFDGYEEHRSVQPEIDMLETMSSIREPGSKEAHLRRAHHCVVAWSGIAGARRFRCVIDSLSTKVTMFSPEGEPLRATCTLKLQEVNNLAKTSRR
jgi:hypothetical protein